MALERSTNQIARYLLEANESQLGALAPLLMDRVAGEFGMPTLPLDHKWPADIIGAVREFLVCVATNDAARLGAHDSIFERLGVESARGGVDQELLVDSIRMAARLVQRETHRAVLRDTTELEPDLVLDLLSRVLTLAEVVITAARRGYDMAGLASADEEELGRQLASEMVGRGGGVADLAVRIGWDPDALVCAVITSPADGAQVVRAAATRPAWFARTRDVVIGLPVGADQLSTSLRPVLGDVDCVVGPAVPLADFPDSLAMSQRLLSLRGAVSSGPTFVDDALLQLACLADPMVVRALRRKYFGELDRLPEDQRAVLVETLHQWLLQWGHRPSIAAHLVVHPQTVSGRLHRLRDLLGEDLDDELVRAELLVLLTAEGAA